MSPQKRAALLRRLNILVEAAKAEAFKGAGHPDDAPHLEKQLADAREAVVEFFERHI